MDITCARSCTKMLIVVLGIAIMSETVNCKSACDINHNACDLNSTCLEPAGVCVCNPGYTGNRCQYSIVNCTDEINCTVNQVCVPVVNSQVRCECSPKHYGVNCFARLCLSNPCVNGTCREDYMNDTHRYTCECHNGYTGQKCDDILADDVQECHPACDHGFCERNATTNETYCNCLSSGYYGKKCQHKHPTNEICSGQNCGHGECITDNVAGRVSCVCKDDYIGENCKHKMKKGDYKMAPLKGPFAGGTLVTCTGNLAPYIDNIRVDGGEMFNITKEIDVVAKTPPYYKGNDSVSKVKIWIELQDKTIFSRVFVYKPNPTVTNIFPRRVVQGGGTFVTITGTNLDAVGDPRLTVIAIKRGRSDTKQTIGKSDKCKASELGDSLKCKSPKIKNNNEERRKRSFELEDTKINIPKRAVSRLRRQEPDEQDDIDFVFGLQLDGVEDYTDLTQNLPNLAYVDVNPDPTFEDGQIFYVEDGGESQIIGIRGENVDSGVVEDFTVSIGNASCSNIGLTNDKLYCYPPTSLLELGDNVRSNNEAGVTVKVGETLSYNVGYVVYEKEETVSLMKVFVPVVAANGAALLIVIIILIICACRKRRTKAEQKQRILPPPSATDIHNLTPGGNDNYYTGTEQSAAPNPYYMVVNGDRKH